VHVTGKFVPSSPFINSPSHKFLHTMEGRGGIDDCSFPLGVLPVNYEEGSILKDSILFRKGLSSCSCFVYGFPKGIFIKLDQGFVTEGTLFT
jgi:hypothetical protein